MESDQNLHQGKRRWHSYHVLVYIGSALTYLLGTVPCTLTTGYGGDSLLGTPEVSAKSLNRCQVASFLRMLTTFISPQHGFKLEVRGSQNLADFVGHQKQRWLGMVPYAIIASWDIVIFFP